MARPLLPPSRFVAAFPAAYGVGRFPGRGGGGLEVTVRAVLPVPLTEFPHGSVARNRAVEDVVDDGWAERVLTPLDAETAMTGAPDRRTAGMPARGVLIYQAVQSLGNSPPLRSGVLLDTYA